MVTETVEGTDIDQIIRNLSENLGGRSLSVDTQLGAGRGLSHAERVGVQRALALFLGTDLALEQLRGTLGDLLNDSLRSNEGHGSNEGHRATAPPGDLSDFSGPNVVLRSLMPADMELAYAAATDPADSFRGRFRGRNIGFSQFTEAVNDGVMSQFVVSSRADGSPQGLVSAYDENPRALHCSVSFHRFPLPQEHVVRGAMIEGMVLFLSYLFSRFPLEKVYAELPEYNASILEGFGIAELEARLSDHFLIDGVGVDKLVFAIRRDSWGAFAAQWVD